MLLSPEVGGNFNAEEVRAAVNFAKALFLTVLPVFLVLLKSIMRLFRTG